MNVTLSPELEKLPYWQEMRDYVNKRMAEEGWEDSIFVRQARIEEEILLQESGNNTLVARREDGTIELVVGSGKYLNYEEIKEFHGKLGIAIEKSVLMCLWIAQASCLGKYFGAFDS